MTITPDTKDWTKVLDAPCAECGFDAAAVDLPGIGGLLRGASAQWQQVLQGAGAASRRNPTLWSPVEYACHMRDVCRVFVVRVERLLTEDEPQFSNWDQDSTAIEDGYAEQLPLAVATELTDAAETLAARFDTVRDTQWERGGWRSDGARLTVAAVARLAAHETLHHLQDAGSTHQGSS
ncbi:MAG: DinB family protein [Mycobacteriales bacterium]